MSLIPAFTPSSGDIELEVTTGTADTVSNIATSLGWNGVSDITLRITGDVGGPITQDVSAFNVKIIIEAGARITGYGGDGATPSTLPSVNGDDGGAAIDAVNPCEVENEGTLAGGGDGGNAFTTGAGGTGTASGGGGGAGIPGGAGGIGQNGGDDGDPGTSTTGGAGGSTPTAGTAGGDLGDQPAITNFANVTYSGGGTIIGGTS